MAVNQSKIVLAWPQEDLGKAGDTVDVDEDRARELVRRGLARRATPTSAAKRASGEAASTARKES